MCRLSWYCDFGVDDRLKHRHLKKKPQPQLFARRLLIQNQLTLYCDTHFINIQPSGNLWSYLLCIGHEKQVIIGYQCFWWCKRVWTGRRDSQQLSSSLLSRQSWSPSHSQSLDTQRPSAQRCSRARSHTDTHTHTNMLHCGIVVTDTKLSGLSRSLSIFFVVLFVCFYLYFNICFTF